MITQNKLIILACRNNLELSKACLKSLLRQTIIPRILIVDNASTDGTTAWARSESARDPGIHVLSYPYTLSVSTLWNLALHWGWTFGDYEEALVVNNDTELLPETYQVLSEWAKPIWHVNDGSESGMVSCVSRRHRDELIYSELTARNNPDFSCFLIKRWAWERIGGFDEGYEGAYGEDCDFHVRLHDAGIPAICISLPFLHHGSGTIKTATEMEKKRIAKNADANRERFFKTYGRRIGTKGYEDLFTDATFGMKRFMTRLTAPL